MAATVPTFFPQLSTLVLTKSDGTPIQWAGTDNGEAKVDVTLSTAGATTGTASSVASGTGSGTYGWVAKDEGAGLARTTGFYPITDNPAVSPTLTALDNTSVLATYTLTGMGAITIETTGPITAAVSDALLRSFAFSGGASTTTLEAGMRSTMVANCSFATALPIPGNGIQFTNCNFNTGTTFVGTQGPVGCRIYGGVGFAAMQMSKRSQSSITGDFLLQGGNLQASAGAYVDIISMGVFDSATFGVSVLGSCDIRIRTSLYGASNTGAGVAVSGGGRSCYDNGATIAVAGSTDFTLGGATSGYAFDNSTGVFSIAGKRNYTWALLTTAYVSAGFGNNAADPFSGAMMVKNV